MRERKLVPERSDLKKNREQNNHFLIDIIIMNDILHLVTVYEVLIYCQTISVVVGYWKGEEIGEYTTLYSPLSDCREWENASYEGVSAENEYLPQVCR